MHAIIIFEVGVSHRTIQRMSITITNITVIYNVNILKYVIFYFRYYYLKIGVVVDALESSIVAT